MKKLSKILLLVLMAFIAVPSFVLADTETIIERTETAYGKFIFEVQNEKLVDGDTYKWGISSQKGVDPENYFDIISPDFDNNTVTLTVNETDYSMLKVIKKSDIVYLTIINSSKEKILDDAPLDVKAPLIHAFEVSKSEWYGGASTNPAYEIYNYYNLSNENVYAMFEKITDAKVINAYVEGIDLNTLSLKGFDEVPENGDSKWFQTSWRVNGSAVRNDRLPEETGLYYLWIKGSDTDTKTVYGYTVIEIGKVTKVEDKVTTTTKKNVTTTTKKVENTTNNKVVNTTQKKEENPKTADTNVLYILAAIIAFGAIGVIGNKKAKNN